PKNIWEEICKEARSMRPPFPDEDAQSASTTKSDYDPKKHTPVFYGKLHHQLPCNDGSLDFDPAVSHPATFGFALLDRPPQPPPEPPCPPPDRKKCSPREYLEHYVFPTLLPAMEAMLQTAGEERCFDRKRTKFNACDFLTEYLYANNPAHPERRGTRLADVPFVRDEWERNPRPPLPLSVLLSDDEAVQIIQNYWRGFLVRRDPEVQELRQWQREWRETNRDARRSVSEFWEQRMGPDSSPRNDDDNQATKGDSTAAAACVDDATKEAGDEGQRPLAELHTTLDYNKDDRGIISPKLSE
ncbi:hypothetical protein BOX15_Mlig034415g3, partial [Macrostomum lignano]